MAQNHCTLELRYCTLLRYLRNQATKSVVSTTPPARSKALGLSKNQRYETVLDRNVPWLDRSISSGNGTNATFPVQITSSCNRVSREYLAQLLHDNGRFW